jgi:two-component system CheB/CheR fusion protein
VEELETTNEELQSTNEELGTINDELRDRAVQLDDLNAFLERILGSIRSAVIVVDRDLRVDVWNHQATDLWGLRSNEVQGAHLLGLDIGLPVEQLKGPIRACLAGDGDRHELRLSARNRRGQPIACSVTCAPLVSAGGTVTGVVLLMDAEPLDEGVAGRRPA